MHKPISLKQICLNFPNKTCFEDFSTQIPFASRIAVIGRNGAGKSSLLHLLQGTQEPTSGEVYIPSDVCLAGVPQVIGRFDSLSGGQRFNASLTAALALEPNVLLLDEPTNHLDRSNRKSLMRFINSFYGSLIVVTHDSELLTSCVDTLWHIDNGNITTFTGNYLDYKNEIQRKRHAVEAKLDTLKRDKQDMHNKLMKEQTRAAKSKSKGKKSVSQKKWPTVVSHAKASRAENTSGRKKALIDEKKTILTEELAALRLPEMIIPTFSLPASDSLSRMNLSIQDGAVMYNNDEIILNDIHLSLSPNERMAICGDNGSGKTTLIKAILDDPSVIRAGEWNLPKADDIGYLDQHYKSVSGEKTVQELLSEHVPAWSPTEIRQHLADFLFRSNESVNTPACYLSGGEKARLSLAMIAAKPPAVLVLDEVTNNLDLETREHVTQVLKNYPGAMLVISHDQVFLQDIAIDTMLQIARGTMKKV